jgi:polynucleotide 5'-hydroxyl-kinase GRC3/NOL9
VSPIDIPPEWNSAADKLIQRGKGKIFVLGASDAGKSTFCRFLYGFLLQHSRSSALIDADIGQKDIGPPACITSGFPNPACGAGPRISGYYFVGDVTPVRHFLPMLVGVTQLVESTEAEFRIINTTGLVHNVGRHLKDSKIQAIRPDIIVAIQRAKEVEVLLRSNRNLPILRVPASSQAVLRTPDERRRSREKAFMEYFEQGFEHELKIDSLIFQRSLIFNGKPVRNPDFIYCEKSAEGILAITETKLPAGTKFKPVPPGFEENLLCGVADRHNTCLGIARLRKIDFRRRTIRLFSPVEADKIAILQWGNIYVDGEGKESRVKLQV